MHSVGSRFVTGPSNILSAGMYVFTFQPRNFTGCGSEGVSTIKIQYSMIHCRLCSIDAVKSNTI